jgi:hypothetical protein
MFSMLRTKQLVGCNWLCLALVIGTTVPVAATAKDEPSKSNWDCAASNNGQWLCSKQQYQSATKRYRPAGRISIPVADPEEPRVSSGLNLDWVDITDMTGEQKRLVDSSCCGGYIEPEQNYPDAEMNPDDASLRINANFTEAITESAAMLEGDVQFSQGYRQARSDSFGSRGCCCWETVPPYKQTPKKLRSTILPTLSTKGLPMARPIAYRVLKTELFR